MPTHKFVLRLLGADDELLGWAEVHVAPRAGGVFLPAGPVAIVIEHPGVVAGLAVHWTDLDIDARQTTDLDGRPVEAGQVIPLVWMDHRPLWLVEGERGVPRPSVTVRTSVTLSPVTGHVGGVGAS